MLPSKGYFKSLNCPYFQNGFCSRPHCHFRHTRKDKCADDNQQEEDVDQSTPLGITDVEPDLEEASSENTCLAPQQLPSTSFCYKPTPIVELKKRHIPITTAPSVTLSSNSQKRRIEYDVKGIRKPKVKYIPEAINSESNSNSVYTTNANSTVYRATKICHHSDELLNGTDADENALLQDTEESEGEIDFDQVSNELNFLDEILKEYAKPVSIKDLTNESNLNDVGVKNCVEPEKTKSKPERLNDTVSNGFLNRQNPSAKNNRSQNQSELDPNHSNESKAHEDSDKKHVSNHSVSKNRTVDDSSNISEKSKRKTSTSNSTSGVKDEKSGSESRRKSVDHHKSERDKNKIKGRSETSCSTKSARRESGSESLFDKLLKPDSNKSSNSNKQSKKEHGSDDHKSSNKLSERKSSSSKSSKKDTHRESNSNKSSNKESERKNSSSKSSKKESDHHSKSSKSSKSESHESSRKRSHSTDSQSHSNSKRHKTDSKTGHKQDDNRKESKYKDENRHRKESNEKRSTKGEKSSNSKKHENRESCDTRHKDRRKRTHSVSESEKSDGESDDVEIISEPGSIIVIDSEEDTDTEKNDSKRKRIVENVESSPSPAHSPGMASPTYLSDVSDFSDEKDNTQDEKLVEPSSVFNGTSGNKKAQDDASLLDHRVQSRIKNRVSLGSAWRPPTHKPVEIMTPAQRILVFAKLREKEEKESDSQSSATRVKIGCVPNVKHLLEEKERLLKESNKNLHSKDKMPTSMSKKPQDRPNQFQAEDKDAPPTAPLLSRHPRNKGADLFTRRAMLEKLYKYEKQLLKPDGPFKDAKDKCLHTESEIWQKTNHDTYEKEMLNIVMQRKSEIPAFTLKYFTSIRPSQSTMFPKELRKKPENGRDPGTHTSDESIYTFLRKYCLTQEQLLAEGYPRKKEEDWTTDEIIAFICPESLKRWKRTPPVPPTGEFVCANCSKFYAVDENGLSYIRGECRYHAKKTCKTLRDKSGLIEKKARCCGNDVSNPCMSSEYHSTETRDLQYLGGFVETQEPKGEMPVEGWGIYALDCEMYWSTRGLELGRVSVVNIEERTVYDTHVKPQFPVTDYSTRMSGLTKENLESATKTLKEVQTDLLKLFCNKTILIGHSLENDLKALQIVHDTVIDTAVVFQDGEYKKALKVLASDLLKEVIQNEEDGHDSAEDATTCIRLMVQKVIKDAVALARRAPPAPRGRYRAGNPGI